MKIGDRQEIGDACIDPFLAGSSLTLRAVAITAGIIGDADSATIIAGLDMAAKPGRPAGLYRPHDASFAATKMADVLSSVRPPMSPKNVRNLEGGTHPIMVPAVSLQVANDQVGWLSIGSCRWKPAYSVPCSTDGHGLAGPG